MFYLVNAIHEKSTLLRVEVPNLEHVEFLLKAQTTSTFYRLIPNQERWEIVHFAVFSSR